MPLTNCGRGGVSEVEKISLIAFDLHGGLGNRMVLRSVGLSMALFRVRSDSKYGSACASIQVDALLRFKYHRITEENLMLSGQVGCKARILPVLIVFFGLWVPVAIAAVNANFFEAAGRGDMPPSNASSPMVWTSMPRGVTAQPLCILPLIMATRRSWSCCLQKGPTSMSRTRTAIPL